MAEETNTPAGNAASTPTNIRNEQSTVDVLDANGNDMKHGDNPLAQIFDRIEAGASAKDAIKDVMEAPAKPTESTPPKETPPAQDDAAKAAAEAKAKADADAKAAEERAKAEKAAQDKDEDRGDIFDKQQRDKEAAAKAKVDADKKAAEDKAAEEKAATEEVTEEELDVQPHDKPKTAKRIKALLGKIEKANNMVAETKKEAEAKAARLAELEAELTKVKSIDPTQNEEIKKQLDELKVYRRRYALENDPEVKQKFDSRVESAEKSIKDTLAKRGAGEALIKLIDEEGGWLKFMDSQRDITLANGETMKASEVAEAIKKALPYSERRAVEAMEIEQVATRRERERYFQEETSKANEYFTKLEKEQQAAREQQQRQIDEARKLIETWRDKVMRDTDWLKVKEVPANATPEQKAAIEDENKYTKQLTSLIDKHLNANKLDDMLEVVMDSVRYHQERRQAARLLDEKKRLETQLAEKQAELDRFKKAASSVPRSGSLVGGSGTAAEPKKDAKPVSLEDALDAIASGKGVSGNE